MIGRMRSARGGGPPPTSEMTGAVLLSALLAIIIVTTLGMAATTFTTFDSDLTANRRSAVQAYFIAEGGLQRALRQLKDDNNWPATLAHLDDAFQGDSNLGNGSYVVQVLTDDPNPGDVRLRSTGRVPGVRGAFATVEMVARPGTPGYKAFDYGVLSCGNQHFNDGVTNVIHGDVFTAGNMHLEAHQIHGDVEVTGNLHIDDASFIVGNAFANGGVQLDSTANPNIDGNLTEQGGTNGAGAVSGTMTNTTNPVTDLCATWDDVAIPPAEIQSFRDNAGTTLVNHTINAGDTVAYSGIVHVSGDLMITGDATLSGNVIFVVDGNLHVGGNLISDPPGSSVTLITEGNLHIDRGGNSVTLDGAMQVGGNLHVDNGTDLTVNGSVVASGDIHAGSGGAFNVQYQSSNDDTISGQELTIESWQQAFN